MLLIYLNRFVVYAIMPTGKKESNAHYVREKPWCSYHQGFSIPFWQGGLIPRLTTAYYFCSAICKYSKQLYLPQQKLKRNHIFPLFTPPFCTCLGEVVT